MLINISRIAILKIGKLQSILVFMTIRLIIGNIKANFTNSYLWYLTG
ncbi:hypothetical protein A1OE_828 [Candidatus Endolissoclinum faulkneri L2]|uniref:Uncharacterized protein n=1 Tax=Candidatus Endolissoclinum faulkneri L2 TaxID=1193729 RepID=K7Z4S2_9PROT|nr:hypothetical protein A1OE_828 [Candidatus Endolissoclinum faulkneri L2]